MKKILLSAAAISAAFSASASSYDDVPFIFSGMFTFFSIAIPIAFIVLLISIAAKVDNISKKVDLLASPVPVPKPNQAQKLSYLVGLGEQEEAQKLAERLTFDFLYNIYFGTSYSVSKREWIDQYLAEKLPKYERLGITLPERLRSGAAFIEYMNNLTGGKVPC